MIDQANDTEVTAVREARVEQSKADFLFLFEPLQTAQRHVKHLQHATLSFLALLLGADGQKGFASLARF